MKHARRAMLVYKDDMLHKKNVVGCGISLKEIQGSLTSVPCVVLFVAKKQPLSTLAVTDVIPPKLGAIPTDVVEIGHLRLLESNRTAYARPAYPGMSIGHYKTTAGTFGAVVYDRRTGAPLILSNNHVLANASDGQDGRCEIGDPIYQPGSYDGGKSKDIIGRLYRFSPVIPISNASLAVRRRKRIASLQTRAQNRNLIDAALAKPLENNMINPQIMQIGLVTDTASVEVGSIIKKSGRTSGLTTGVVRALSATLDVELDEGRSARFVDQIVASPMGQPGDSGSLGVTGTNKAFGLLFAGSDSATIFNRIENILELLSVRMTP